MPVKIITDTMCDVPPSFATQYDIRIVPLTVHFGEESYKGEAELSMDEFYKRLATAETLPTTSQVTPMEFMIAFREELDKGNTVICINGSAKMSGTHNSAVLAKNQLESEDVYAIDSANITLGAGMLVIKAAKMAKQGVPAQEIVKEIEESKKRMKEFFVVDTLKYLHKGGRLSLSASIVGSILNIKPILTVKDGELAMLDKARGMKKALSIIMDMIEEGGYDLNGKIIGLNHSAVPEQADAVEEMIRARYNVKEFVRGEVGMLVATHAGPGCIALHFEA